MNRVGQALPQIPKAYIRVKDENMTVFTVKKYLVRKLGLSNEAEIDILCMGQNLLQTQTLKQVRDAVWLPGLIQSINSTALVFATSQGRPINHLMQLHYGRRCLV
ncbi:protein LAX PANICLE 2-like [Pistacia vera]|uniref:protein LAX PANICLE 2-like n=1 Tax=Pistacia vera TaxID=55513 RepID=UPI001263310C|nr:protein LAX PANICLE 2-like [Pistacia vera]